MQFEAEEGSCSCCSFHFSLSSTPDQNKPVQLWVFDIFSAMLDLTNLINFSKQKRLGNVCCQVLCQATEFSGVWYVRMQFNLKFIAAVSNSHLLQSYIWCIFVLFRCNIFLALKRALYETSSFWAAAYGEYLWQGFIWPDKK